MKTSNLVEVIKGLKQLLDTTLSLPTDKGWRLSEELYATEGEEGYTINVTSLTAHDDTSYEVRHTTANIELSFYSKTERYRFGIADQIDIALRQNLVKLVTNYSLADEVATFSVDANNRIIYSKQLTIDYITDITQPSTGDIEKVEISFEKP